MAEAVPNQPCQRRRTPPPFAGSAGGKPPFVEGAATVDTHTVPAARDWRAPDLAAFAGRPLTPGCVATPDCALFPPPRPRSFRGAFDACTTPPVPQGKTAADRRDLGARVRRRSTQPARPRAQRLKIGWHGSCSSPSLSHRGGASRSGRRSPRACRMGAGVPCEGEGTIKSAYRVAIPLQSSFYQRVVGKL